MLHSTQYIRFILHVNSTKVLNGRSASHTLKVPSQSSENRLDAYEVRR